ncbi:MAG: COX15/CtaA family protein [Opitutales bacterium]|nr:COX15/CtaA family protein [Opitutales bacterium]
MSATKRTDSYKIGLFVFSCFSLVWACFLLYAGGFTTSIQAGMAFLDWPLSNGSLNPERWMSQPDQAAEHSHRLLGMKLGLLAIISVVWHAVREERKAVRVTSYVLLAAVVSQGVLGGLRVLLDQLNHDFDSNVIAQSFAIAHACGAQIVFCILAALAVMHSPMWFRREAAAVDGIDRVRALGWASTTALFLQILVGAIMRHNHAGLAISTFPMATETSLLPAIWNFHISIHFAHRAGALIATAILVAFFVQVWKRPALRAELKGNAVLMLSILAFQIYLGALTIWTGRNPHAATVHMLVAAFLMGSTWIMTFRLYQFQQVAAYCVGRPERRRSPVDVKQPAEQGV